MNTEEQSRGFIRRALELAAKAWGQTHPNPMVGAVIVEQGKIVAEGWHRVAGGPHAEIEALRALGRRPKSDAVMYVTLEPCSTSGQTDACTTAIIESGIRKLVVGTMDPNPDHAGRGLDLLRMHGIDVVHGILEAECMDLNLIFNRWIVNKKPMVAMKMALTLDGKFAAASGHSQWVTGEAARADVMRWRRYFPAIAVGANTVLMDDPKLTSRMKDSTWCPRRFVFDRDLKTLGQGSLPGLYSDEYKEQTTVFCGSGPDVEQRKLLSSEGVTVKELPEVNGQLDFNAFLEHCVEEEICGIYFEAGPSMVSKLLEGRQADYAFVYLAPKFINDEAALGIGNPRKTQFMHDAVQLKNVKHAIFGDDVLVRGNFED